MIAPLLSFQLWSSRTMPTLRDEIQVLAEAGYDDVQPYHLQCTDPQGFRDLIDEFGLSARSIHANHAMLQGDLGAAVTASRIIGADLVILPSIPKEIRPSDREGWLDVGQSLKRIADDLATEGLKFAWHNHDQELRPLPDGSYPIEHILGDDLLWEIDIGWAQMANADIPTWLKRYSGRIPAIHAKDIPPAGENLEEDGQIAIGLGILDWETLWDQCLEAGVGLIVAEHDQPVDPAAFARISGQTLRRLRSERPAIDS